MKEFQQSVILPAAASGMNGGGQPAIQMFQCRYICLHCWRESAYRLLSSLFPEELAVVKIIHCWLVFSRDNRSGDFPPLLLQKRNIWRVTIVWTNLGVLTLSPPGSSGEMNLFWNIETKLLRGKVTWDLEPAEQSEFISRRAVGWYGIVWGGWNGAGPESSP